MEVINETLTAEVKAEIENLVNMAKQREYEFGCMITPYRYAVRDGQAFDNTKGFIPIEVTRYIRAYGSGIVGINDVIDGCQMYSKDAVVNAGLTPVSEREIAKHGKITKFVIDKEAVRRIYNAE